MNEPSSGSIASDLNTQQREAISWGGAVTLVNACAGSGKTATATAKVARWISSGVEPSRILILTFTRKAAWEMKARIAKRLGVESCPIEGGTYHATALKLMKQAPSAFDLPDRFSVLDDDGCEKIWKKALRKCGGDPKEARRAMGIHSLTVNLIEDPEIALQKELRTEARGVAKAFAELKKESRLLDFDDILCQWRAALHEGRGGGGRWTHVMVDEFQDNSEIQYDILKMMGAKELFVVGDPNQCIYSFRGSAPRLMKRFASDHPSGKVFTLALNYRSSQTVLDAANEALAGGECPVALHAGQNKRGLVYKYVFGDGIQEAEFIQRGILWRMKAGTTPDQIAVLFRAGHQSTHIEMALRRARIAYKKYGGISITDAAEVKDFLAMLKVWHNPLDRVSRVRVACLFPGVGEKGAEKAAERGEPSWPIKAQAAGLWMAQAQAAGWPKGAQILGDKLAETLKSIYPDDHEMRAERVAALSEAAGHFESLGDFLEHYSTGEEGASGGHPADCITLSTIHSAKGLEWNDVFLAGSGGSQIPSKRAAENGQSEEERRLLYVALTRSRHFLSLSYPEFTPRNGWQGPTPFLCPTGWKKGG